MTIVDVTHQWLTEEMGNEEFVLIDFWAPWCAPCKRLAPIVEEVDQKVGDQLKIAKVNTDDHTEESLQDFHVMGIPKLMLFKKGELVEDIVGELPKEKLLEILNKHL